MAFKYYSTAGVFDYDRVLKHFQHQASGGKSSVMITGQKKNRNLVIVNSRTSAGLEVVDPVQSSVNQAGSKLENSVIKDQDPSPEAHSSLNKSKKRKSVGAEIRKRTKRAKDIFSEDGR